MEKLLNKIFHEATDLFFVEEIENILNDVNERNLCCRLAIYLNEKVREADLVGYYVNKIEFIQISKIEVQNPEQIDHPL